MSGYVYSLEMKYHALRTQYEELLYGVARKWPGETRHQTALRYILRAEEPRPEDSVACTDRPELRAKFLGAFDNVIKGPCTAHDAFSTACLEDGDQYLEPEGK